MSESYLVGDTIRTFFTVEDPDGVPTNGTVTLTVTDPSGNVTTPSPTNVSTGLYEYYLALDEAGWFDVVWFATVSSYTKGDNCSYCAVSP